MEPGKSVRTLLIEDDPDDVLFMQMFLSAFGDPALRFELEVADRLEAGIERLTNGAEFDVVLLDLMLPDSSGIETFLRVMSSKPDAAVIVLTGLQDEKAALEAVSLGAQDYLHKGGLSEGLLKKAILYAIERRRLVSHLEAIIAGAVDGMVVVDSAGIVRYLNKAAEALFGESGSQTLGRPFPYRLAEPGQTAEVRIRGEESQRPLEMRVTAIEWKKAPARLVALRDVGELRRLESLKAEIRERRKMEKLKDEFFTAVSHELRTPLTIAKAAVSNLRAGYAGQLAPKQAEVLRLAHRSLRRLVRFVNNILDLARLETGKAAPRRRTLKLGLLLHDAVDGFELAAEEKVAVECRLPPELPQVEGDPDLLAEVLGNLLDNAVRYARSKVEVSAHVMEPASIGASTSLSTSSAPTTRQIEVVVADDGPGIEPAELAQLFDRFAQAKRQSGSAGMGIGLALCKEIVEQHGGKIWAESRPGQGTRMKFTLPVQ